MDNPIVTTIQDRLHQPLIQLRWDVDAIGTDTNARVVARLNETTALLCDTYAQIGRDFGIPRATDQAMQDLRELIGSLTGLLADNIHPMDAHILCCVHAIEADAVTVATVAATIRQAA